MRQETNRTIFLKPEYTDIGNCRAYFRSYKDGSDMPGNLYCLQEEGDSVCWFACSDDDFAEPISSITRFKPHVEVLPPEDKYGLSLYNKWKSLT